MSGMFEPVIRQWQSYVADSRDNNAGVAVPVAELSRMHYENEMHNMALIGAFRWFLISNSIYNCAFIPMATICQQN